MSQQFRRTKIIATLGPTTDQNNNLEKIIASGTNMVRLNFSHGKITEHIIRAEKVREIALRLNKHIAILGDLQGPKIRISTFKDNKIYLKSGDNFILDTTITNNQGNHKCVGVNYKKLPQEVHPGDLLLLDDGRIQLQVSAVHNSKIYTKVITGGILSNNKGINKLGGGLSAKILTNKDKIDIINATKIGVDYLAISFLRNSIDLNNARKLIIDAGSNAKIISKLERAEVVASDEAIDDIIIASDAVMVARGDLGIEIGTSELAGIQKKIIQRAHILNKAVITATQMMESMITNSIPTRAEVMDVANAVLDGTDAVMLSAETAIGKYPSETVNTVANICLGAEKISHNNYTINTHQPSKKINNVEEAIAISTMHIANTFNKISAVISITELENIVLLMSRIRSKLPIFVFSRHKHVLNIVTLYKGVIPVFFNKKNENIENTTKYASDILRDKGFIKPGELIIATKDNLNPNINNIGCIFQVK